MIRTGNSMSQLDIAERCGLAPGISKLHGRGNRAMMGRAFHAKAAEQSGHELLQAALTERDRDEIDRWHIPEDVISLDLRYSMALKETKVAIDNLGCGHFANETTPYLTTGILDFAWQKGRVVYVGDIKASMRTPSATPHSLQLHAYGIAYSGAVGVEHYCTGIWGAEEGQWWWADRVFDRNVMLGRVMTAAANTESTGTTGPHCGECYSRLHCPEYVMPFACAESVLGPVAAGQIPTSESAATLLLTCKRAKEVAAKAEEQLKAWVRAGELEVRNGSKVWTPCWTSGRKIVSKSALEADGLLEKYTETGNGFWSMRWSKG